MAEGHKPTKKMAANAEKGLMLRERFGGGGTDVGVKRARQLARGGSLSDDDVQSMHSYFARHVMDKDGKTHAWGDDDDPSAGYIACLRWDGDDGRDWADRARGKIAG